MYLRYREARPGLIMSRFGGGTRTPQRVALYASRGRGMRPSYKKFPYRTNDTSQLDARAFIRSDIIGGTDADNAHAMDDAWEKVCDFLDIRLRRCPPENL